MYCVSWNVYFLNIYYASYITPLFIHILHCMYGLNLWGFKHKRITILQKKAIRILAFRPYISHSTSAFKELKIRMLKDLYISNYTRFITKISIICYLYISKDFYLTTIMAQLTTINLRHQALRLPMTGKEYYVQSTKYQLLKLTRETPQLELDRCLTSSLMQFMAYFKYKIIEAYNAVCNVRNCYICQ